MKISHIHIIAFDLPYPPDYGGATDIYHKIRSLYDLGVKITLHVFLYKGKMPAPALEALTEKTHYYYRRRFVNPFWGSKPYVVTTRNSEKLMRNLLLDDYPILFEGLHTTAYLGRPELKDRTMVVRAHNVEHNYYRALGEAERPVIVVLHIVGSDHHVAVFEFGPTQIRRCMESFKQNGIII